LIVIQQLPSTPDISSHHRVQNAATISALTHRESGHLATIELQRLLELLKTLSDIDWSQPTACPLWNVREMVAHLTGTTASYASWTEFKRQNDTSVLRPYMKRGMTRLDAMNQVQVNDRANVDSAALLDELQVIGPQAIRTRQRLPWLLRAVRFPFGKPLGFVPIGYLTDLIYTRDMWMHRLDICRATGKPMVLTREHDGRVIDLVLRDLALTLGPKLGGQSIMLILNGEIGGAWRIGKSATPAATFEMDVIDFTLLTSGRLSTEEITRQIVASGDQQVVATALANIAVPY
jgi:uncharacterized protein (TIGR03083 family)